MCNMQSSERDRIVKNKLCFRPYFHTYGSVSLTWVTFQVSYVLRRSILRSDMLRDGVGGGV
jgi:hypothetical protein